jgi:hypothetical protein
MIYQNSFLRLQEMFLRWVLKEPLAPKQPSDCFLNPPCGCSSPGNTMACENCPHLEACLSHFKRLKFEPVVSRNL